MGTPDCPSSLTDRVTAVARRIERRATELGYPDCHRQKGRTWRQDVGNPLRSLNRCAEERLRAHGFLDATVGAECVRVGTWQGRRQETMDEHLYLYLLRDCIECHFIFYKHYHLFEDDDAFRDAVADNHIGSRSERKVVATLSWLEELDTPTDLASRQVDLATVLRGRSG